MLWRQHGMIASTGKVFVSSTLAKMWLEKFAFQLGMYAVQVVRDTIYKGFVRPFYGLCVADREWRGGMVDPFGVITLKDNAITDDSLKRFEAQQKNTFDWFRKKGASEAVNKKAPITRQRLQKLLARAHERYYLSNIPDGDYVVGFYYIDHEEHTWDGSMYKLSSKDPLSSGTIKLVEGLLHIFVGDEVLKWIKEIIMEMLREMQEAEEEWCARKQSLRSSLVCRKEKHENGNIRELPEKGKDSKGALDTDVRAASKNDPPQKVESKHIQKEQELKEVSSSEEKQHQQET
ncbi:hypothetical protein GOP47_0020444 [Adiantum capillus-veneris]|uniref:Uncharacterized protein n=1 Tax=Adiantum capillus-veneris TaxID=13818 RepID=A0A9D4Z6Z8_ADICA|nr:hypothetical protein GOP47_0020444 [Adiantum capillus-veneris]